MLFHEKDPIHTVKIDNNDLLHSQFPLEKFDGDTGDIPADEMLVKCQISVDDVLILN